MESHIYSCPLNHKGLGAPTPTPCSWKYKIWHSKNLTTYHPWVSEGDWFQEPPRIRNLWTLEPPVWNGADKCVLSAVYICELPTAGWDQRRYLFLYLCVSGPGPFKPMSFIGQLYINGSLKGRIKVINHNKYFNMWSKKLSWNFFLKR